MPVRIAEMLAFNLIFLFVCYDQKKNSLRWMRHVLFELQSFVLYTGYCSAVKKVKKNGLTFWLCF